MYESLNICYFSELGDGAGVIHLDCFLDCVEAPLTDHKKATNVFILLAKERGLFEQVSSCQYWPFSSISTFKQRYLMLAVSLTFKYLCLKLLMMVMQLQQQHQVLIFNVSNYRVDTICLLKH